MLWMILSVLVAAGVQVQPRDAAPAKEGTASIRGRITAADTGLPLRRAVVMLMGSGPSGSRSVATNPDGRFVFSGLPGGSYRLRATPGAFRAQYLAIFYGSSGPNEGGEPIELKDGQRFVADIALPRGGVIVGRVTDEFGEPIARAQVFASRAMAGSGVYNRVGGGFHQTDDQGRFRLYGLEPGVYIVGAEMRGSEGPPVQGGSEGFVPTYSPTTVNEQEATRIRVTSAGETGDVDIQLIRTQTFQIRGTITDSKGRPVLRPHVYLSRSTGTSGTSFGFGVEQAGTVVIRDVIPGDYRLNVRTGSMDSLQQPTSTQERPEYASIPLTVTGDIDNLAVVTQPGVSITGQVVFAEGVLPNPRSALRVMLHPADPRGGMFGSYPSAEVAANLQFTLNDLFGAQLVRISGLPSGYALKAVTLGSTDITDTPIEFKPEHSKHVQVIVTSRASALEGTVTNDAGEPAASITVVMIPEDKTSWKANSARLRFGRTLKTGKFSMTGVLAGRYYVVATPREGVYLGQGAGPEVYESLTKEATIVVIGEDEKRTVDLRVATTR